MVEERLDRALANMKWLSIFSDVRLLNTLASHSHHSPILLQCEPVQICCYKYSFKFENRRLQEEEIEEVVNVGWNRDKGVEINQRISGSRKN